jgi:hypothetical protein
MLPPSWLSRHGEPGDLHHFRGRQLIGAAERRGCRCNVIGVQAHLDDHALQQFLISLTNQPVLFQYEAVIFEGKQLGVITIRKQRRPLYLRRDYGRLKKEKVYVRRGTSTDLSRPASIEEIAQMRLDDERPPIVLPLPNSASTNRAERRIEYPFTVTAVHFGCNPNTTGNSTSMIQVYIRSGKTGEKNAILNEFARLRKGESLIDITNLLCCNPSGGSMDFIGVDLIGVGTDADGLFIRIEWTGH